MVTTPKDQPHPTHNPPPPPPVHPSDDPSVNKVNPHPDPSKGPTREDKEKMRGERRHAMEDAPPIANEQMERSRQIETMGLTEWQATQDQRPPEEQPVLVKDALPVGDVLNTPVEGAKRVPGVSHPTTPLPERAPVRDADGNIPKR